jgi:hypothetical protein
MHRRPGQDSRVEKRNVGNNGGQRHPESKPWTRRSVGRRRRSNACATAANIPIRLATLWRGGNKSRSITVQPSPGSTGSCTHTRCVITFKNQRNSALRSDRGASRQLLLAALNRQFELLLSVPSILEYEAVMTRPQHLAACGLSSAEVGHVLDDLVNECFWRHRTPICSSNSRRRRRVLCQKQESHSMEIPRRNATGIGCSSTSPRHTGQSIRNFCHARQAFTISQCGMYRNQLRSLVAPNELCE